MKLIVGLGNPGKRYKDTRHNVGFLVADEFAGLDGWKKNKKGVLVFKWLQSGADKVEVVKPQTFMNESGRALSYIRSQHSDLEMESIFVIHDDLDIKLGEYKIQKGKGPKDHNGLNSIYRSLGTKDFWHVRVGVENRSVKSKISGEDYVLRPFDFEEEEIVDKVVKEVVGEIKNAIS